MKVVERSNTDSRCFRVKQEISADTSSCYFRSNDITRSASDPLFVVFVLLSLELDSKSVGIAFSSPFTVAIQRAIRENIFKSIPLLSKVFSSSHPNA